MLLPNVYLMSACNDYRGRRAGQTVEEYVQQLADELDGKFQEVDPKGFAYSLQSQLLEQYDY
ncbi:hypothetical protein QQX98_009135, partial [Neonectria punicea]